MIMNTNSQENRVGRGEEQSIIIFPELTNPKCKRQWYIPKHNVTILGIKCLKETVSKLFQLIISKVHWQEGNFPAFYSPLSFPVLCQCHPKTVLNQCCLLNDHELGQTHPVLRRQWVTVWEVVLGNENICTIQEIVAASTQRFLSVSSLSLSSSHLVLVHSLIICISTRSFPNGSPAGQISDRERLLTENIWSGKRGRRGNYI